MVSAAVAERGRAVRVPLLLVANLGQAVPSIALLALVFTVTGFTFRTTVIALVVYAVLPILRAPKIAAITSGAMIPAV